jgi:hypothetical protein
MFSNALGIVESFQVSGSRVHGSRFKGFSGSAVIVPAENAGLKHPTSKTKHQIPSPDLMESPAR